MPGLTYSPLPKRGRAFDRCHGEHSGIGRGPMLLFARGTLHRVGLTASVKASPADSNHKRGRAVSRIGTICSDARLEQARHRGTLAFEPARAGLVGESLGNLQPDPLQ